MRRPYQSQFKGESLQEAGEGYLQQFLVNLGKHLEEINGRVLGTRTRGLDYLICPFKSGDWVYSRNFTGNPLEEKWNEPYQVLLITFIAIKIKG